MKELKLRHETKFQGRKLIISTVPYGSGYETIAMRANGHDLELVRTSSPEAAEAVHRGMLLNYLPLPHRRLVENLKEAFSQAYEERHETDDGGTCNFDSPAICLEGWQEYEVESVAYLANCGCYRWGGSRKSGFYHDFVFTSPFLAGQGNRRSAISERAVEILTDHGWKAIEYCQMD